MTCSAQVWPSVLVLCGLSGCEMFIGDFVERQESNNPQETVTECEQPVRCRGADVESCVVIDGVQKRTIEDQCGSSELCNKDRFECMLCRPGSFQCQGDALQQCDSLGNAWGVVKTCAAGTEKCDQDTGECELCLPGDTKCEVTNGVHYRLECQATSEGRVWASTNCNSYICDKDDKGVAYCQTCTTEGEKSCAGTINGEVSDAIVECTSDLRWVTTPCPEGVCDNNQCVVQ